MASNQIVPMIFKLITMTNFFQLQFLPASQQLKIILVDVNMPVRNTKQTGKKMWHS